MAMGNKLGDRKIPELQKREASVRSSFGSLLSPLKGGAISQIPLIPTPTPGPVYTSAFVHRILKDINPAQLRKGVNAQN